MFEFLKCLVTAHECYPEERTVDGAPFLFFNGPSPDEITLVDFCKNQGIVVSASSDHMLELRLYPESGLIENEEAGQLGPNIGDEDEVDSKSYNSSVDPLDIPAVQRRDSYV